MQKIIKVENNCDKLSFVLISFSLVQTVACSSQLQRGNVLVQICGVRFTRRVKDREEILNKAETNPTDQRRMMEKRVSTLQ